MNAMDIAFFSFGMLLVMWIIAMSALWDNRRLMRENYNLRKEIFSYESAVRSNRVMTNKDRFNATIGELVVAVFKSIFK